MNHALSVSLATSDDDQCRVDAVQLRVVTVHEPLQPLSKAAGTTGILASVQSRPRLCNSSSVGSRQSL
jgi:hypothetical protein